MAKLRVTIIDEVRNRRLKVDLPDDAAIEKLLPALAKKLGLPPAAYRLTHEATGRALGGDQTLASFGVRESDALRLAAAREEAPVVLWPAEEEAVFLWQRVPVWGWAAVGAVVLLIAVIGAFLAGRGAKPRPAPTVVAEAASPAVTEAPPLAALTPTATPGPPTLAPTSPPLPTATPVPPSTPAQPTDKPVPSRPKVTPAAKKAKLILWNEESGAEDVKKAIVDWTIEYTDMHPEVTFEVVDKQTETLREDFQTASLAGTPPDILWTVNDHAGPFIAADIIQPVDDLFDLGVFVDSALAAVEQEGKHWGVPISNGNHLMLLYNKKLVSEPPKDTDELFKMGKELTSGDIYGLVWNQTEPFWLVPWLGGFKGKVFAEDGVTPTLNTPEMIATLKFLHDMKYDAQIIPAESDYDLADALFKEGKAAMIINGDWSLGGCAEIEGLEFGVARIPKVTATGEWPKPYTSGKYFMLPKDLSGDKLEAAKGFINWVTSKEVQLRQLDFKRLPAREEALDDPRVAEDSICKGSAEQMTVGTPMPTVIEMRCNWDAMKPEMQAVLADTKTPEEAAAAMQAAAENCIKTLE